jgi:hypothetical protein
MKKSFLVILILAFVILPNGVWATEITFGDSVFYWDTWKSSDSDWGSHDNTTDSIGHPSITGGNCSIDSRGYLSQVNIFYTSYDPLLKAGDLFIDVGSNSDWDYVLTSKGKIYDFTGTTFSALKGENDYLYEITSEWERYNIRNDHPFALSEEGINSSVEYGGFGFAGFDGKDGSINFTGFKINVGNTFTLGFGPNCANDMIYETVATPVPAALLLLGSGLIGLAGLRKKLKGHSTT